MLKMSLKKQAPSLITGSSKTHSDLILCPVLLSGKNTQQALKQLPEAFSSVQGQLATQAKQKGFKAGSTISITLFNEQQNKSQLLAVVAVDAEANAALQATSIATSLKQLSKQQQASSAELVLSEGLCCYQLAFAIEHAFYLFSALKTKSLKPLSLKSCKVITDRAPNKAQKEAFNRGQCAGKGANLTRELGNLPGNVCTPQYLSQLAKDLAKKSDKVKTNIKGEKQMEKMGMGSFLSVSKGSDREGQLISIEYNGAKNSKAQPYVLIGKGITFDTGGISLKPGGGMDEMKFDMGGAASVMGTMQAVIEMQLPINVVGIIAAAENMPSGGATRPGDIVTSMSGQTIEILNTDAEGRLVLCDTLTYAAKYKPKAMIDLATLTGACVVALGAHASAVYSYHDKLADELLSAGEQSHDRAWRMPLWDDYQKQIESSYADIANIGGPKGGSITAACFLARFVDKKIPWAHMDIAGSAWHSVGPDKGSTGRPVGLLLQYLMSR